jgi:lipoate-protein ligase A
VLGCSQRGLHEVVARRLGGQAELVVRETGGGAVLTGPWLVGASVVLPYGHAGVGDGLIESYRWLGQLHVDVLDEFGVLARVVPPHELPQTDEADGVGTVGWACFGSLSPWEVVNAEGRKLVGLAQRRRQTGVLLVAGTLISAVDWSLLCAAMGQPQQEPLLRRRTVSVEEMMGRQPEPERFASALMQRLARALVQ